MKATQQWQPRAYTASLTALYGETALADAQSRLERLMRQYSEAFGEPENVLVLSAPGRTELGGNHTDHNGGVVLAASVNADILAVVGRTDSPAVCIRTADRPAIQLSLDTLSPKSEERRTSAALVRGVAAYIQKQGGAIGGFHAVTDARVPVGSGLSSSAAFEVLIGAVFNYAYNDGALPFETLALAGGYAENTYFDKPSGLMDQIACAAGGVITVDFADPTKPAIRRISLDFDKTGYRLCMVDVGGDHAGLTDAYAAIPQDMKTVAGVLGQKRLADTTREALLARLPEVRRVCGDRAVLRALHFFLENERVQQEVAALERGDMAAFLRNMTRSGHSSFEYLQNISLPDQPWYQPMAVALHLAQLLLENCGGWRVHGGGFGGCIQAILPSTQSAAFVEAMESALGQGCCRLLSIRSVGSVRLAAV